MARNTHPVCKMCRREQMKLYLKGERCFSPKCPIDREALPPGMHGARRSKTSEYGIRLREKQKLKRFYGVLEAQFRRYYSLATKTVGNTGEQLLSILERRLDNVVHRLGLAVNRNSARQMVAHGHILINGAKCRHPLPQGERARNAEILHATAGVVRLVAVWFVSRSGRERGSGKPTAAEDRQCEFVGADWNCRVGFKPNAAPSRTPTGSSTP